tara:strand:- start:1264 stop:1380 length:117 start_codon:yes stop_codon:yes gene_type:complete
MANLAQLNSISPVPLPVSEIVIFQQKGEKGLFWHRWHN